MNNLPERNLCADNVRRCFFVLALSWSLLIFLLLLTGWQRMQEGDFLQTAGAWPSLWSWAVSLGLIWVVVLFFLGIGIRSLARNARALQQARLDLSRHAGAGLLREARFNALFSSLPDAAMFADDQDRIVSVNPAFTDITGYSQEEVQGKNPLFLFSQPGAVLNSRGKLRQKPCAMECRRKDTSTIPVETLCTYVVDTDGADMGYLIILRDIVQRERAERELEELKSRLRQAGRMEAIGTLAGGIAHDFNNVLGIIFINSDIALEDIPEGNPARLNVRRIINASERARNLVKQILAYSRQTEQRQIPLMPGSLLKESLKFLRTTAPAGISVEELINDGFRSIMVDPAQLQELIINLFSHALQSLGERGIIAVNATVVELNGRDGAPRHDIPSGHYFRVSVSHALPGQAPAGPGGSDTFFQENTFPGEEDFGLSAAGSLVRGLNGYLVTGRMPGSGAIVEVYFPIVAMEVGPEEADEPLQGSERVLLVDDEDMLVEMASMFLERHGYSVTAKTASQEALAAFRTSPDAFDIVITDQTMPEMTGFELAGELFKIRPDIPVILLSGYCKKISEQDIRDQGIREFLYKPFDGKALVRSIRKTMAGRQ